MDGWRVEVTNEDGRTARERYFDSARAARSHAAGASRDGLPRSVIGPDGREDSRWRGGHLEEGGAA